MKSSRIETDSLGKIRVPANRLWGAQTERSLLHFNISHELIPKEMIPAYALIKKGAAIVNGQKKLLSQMEVKLIVEVCDELLKGKFTDEFPLHVWMTGSGTQFNMNVNEVISNRICQIAKTPLGSKKPVHPNDHVNRSQSSNDTFPTAMHIAAAISTQKELLPVLKSLQLEFVQKGKKWKKIIKLGRTHYQDATPMSLGDEFSGYGSLLKADIERIEEALIPVYELTLGGTAIGTGINAFPGFGAKTAKLIAQWTKLPFITAPNKFATQGSHDALIHLSAALKTTAVSLYKIADDIRFLSCGPRAGINELILPSNEPGSSIMPGKVNPTQCEALIMGCIQVISNDLAVSFGGASGHLEMNVAKPLIIHNLLQSIRILKDASHYFHQYLLKGLKPNQKQIQKNLDHSLMLVTALTPEIGYDKASQIAHAAMEKDLTLKQAALQSGFISEKKFDQLIQKSKKNL